MMNIVTFDRSLEPKLSAHFSRHWAESGRDRPHFLQFDLTQPDRPNGVDPDACLKALSEYGWQRWLLVLVEDQVRGHCSLKSGDLKTSMHRCQIGVGLEAGMRNMGIGQALLDRALQIAKSAPNIEWIDLRVLSENRPAIALYEKFGFRTVGVIEDRYRIRGESLNEVIMTLRLVERS